MRAGGDGWVWELNVRRRFSLPCARLMFCEDTVDFVVIINNSPLETQ